MSKKNLSKKVYHYMNCEIYDPLVRESVARWGNCVAKKKNSRKRGNYFKASLFCDIQKVDTVRMKKQENLFLKSTDS